MSQLGKLAGGGHFIINFGTLSITVDDTDSDVPETPGSSLQKKRKLEGASDPQCDRTGEAEMMKRTPSHPAERPNTAAPTTASDPGPKVVVKTEERTEQVTCGARERSQLRPQERSSMEPVYNFAKTEFVGALVDRLKKLKYADNVISDVEKTTNDVISSVSSDRIKDMKTKPEVFFIVILGIRMEVTRRLKTLPSFMTLDKSLQDMLCESVNGAALHAMNVIFG
ncbi:hypothetical protein MTO96_035624 [Rhipicephalus appendiculatus]